jgi:short-subunit dehydrogenase
VSVVFPGAIGTNIMVNSGVEIKMTTQLSDNAKKYSTLLPLEVVEEIVDGMERNKKRIYVGKDSRFMNFLYRLSPAYASRMIARNMKNLLGD